MANAFAIVFIDVFITEAVVIIIGNTFNIFVFWTQRFHLKRTCFLLISLAVADLPVGLTDPIVLGTKKFGKTTSPEKREDKRISLSTAFQVLGSSTSVFFLALISLERVFAVLCPLRHRVTSTRPYICSIVISWAAGFCMAGISLIETYHRDVGRVYAMVVTNSCLFVSVLVICVSYVTIRTRLRPAAPDLQVHNRNLTEHNLLLSRTMFIVVGVSVVFWLPAFVVYIIRDNCSGCVSTPVVSTVNVLHLANSMVNPFVYSFRMPIFKDVLKKRMGKSLNAIKLRPVEVSLSNVKHGTCLYYPSYCSLVQYQRKLT